MEQRFSTPTPLDLHVEVDRGEVSITAADTTESVVRVEGDQPERLRVELRGDRLSAVVERRSLFDLAPRLQVWVTVPTDSRVVVRTGSAEVATLGRLAQASVSTGSGDVEVAEATGLASVQTGSGAVRLGSAGEVRVKTGSGDVEVGQAAGVVRIGTGSGDIAVGRAWAPAALKTASGDIEVQQADADLSLGAASGNVEVGRVGRGEVTVSTASGAVSIGVPPGVPVWTDISTVTGTLGSDLRGAGRPEPGQESIRLRAKTVSGDVRLVQLESAETLR